MFGVREIENFIGSRLGYGTCPNCNDSWYWKEDSSLLYDNEKTQKTIVLNGKATVGTVTCQTHIMICKECMSNPEKIDPIRTRKALEKTKGWEKEKIDLVIDSIEKYKNECKVGIEQ